MTGQVTLYFNTGFNGTDIPASAAALIGARSKTYNDVYWIREDIDKPSIKIADTYENVRDVDYVAITTAQGTSYFFAGAPQPIAKGVMVISLDLDALLTMGGAENLTYISGWEERGHIAKADDKLFENVAAEDWVPSQPLQNRNITKLTLEADPRFPADLDILVSNTDIPAIGVQDMDEQDVIAGIKDGEAVMYWPKIPHAKTLTGYKMWDFQENRWHDFAIPNTSAFNAGNTTVKAGLEKLFAAGQLQLQASYKIPKEWIGEATMNPDGAYQLLVGAYGDKTLADIPFEYSEGGYTPKNKKVFSTYRTYALAALGTGDMCVKSPEDIYDGHSAAPRINLWCDMSSTGKPYARFEYIKGYAIQYTDCVKGLQWANNQLVIEGASGSMWNSINTAFSNQQIQRSIQQNTFNTNQAIQQGEYTAQGIRLSQEKAGYDAIAQSAGAIASVLSSAQGNVSIGSKIYGGADRIITKKTLNVNGSEIAKNGLGGAVSDAIGANINYHMAQKSADLSLNQLNTNIASLKGNAGMNEQAMLQQINENNIGLIKNNNVVAPTVMFTPEQNLGLYGYNYFVCYETRKSLDDLKSEDMYYQRFGYNGLHRPLTQQCFKERQYYCYVQAFDVNLKGAQEFGLRIRAKAISQLNKGVRVWKVLPDASYYELN